MPNLPKLKQSENTIGRVEPSTRIDVEVTSGSTAARDAIRELLSRLAVIALEPEESSTVELIIAEVLNNIVEHAYPESDPEGPIHLECSQFADGLHFHVKDRGRMMPDGKAPMGNMQPYDVGLQDLPEGGFGWFLIKDLAKDVQYRRVGEENHLDLRIAVAYGAAQ